MEIFLLLLLAHMVADYPLQTGWVFQQKFKSLPGGLYHAGILYLCHLVLLFPYLGDKRVVIGISIIAVLHYLQDYVKVVIFDRKKWMIFFGYILDQFLHLMIFSIFTYIALSYFTPLPIADPTKLYFWHKPIILLYLITLIGTTFTWDISRFTWRRGKEPDLTYERDWHGIILRGIVLTGVFWASYYYLLDLSRIIS